MTTATQRRSSAPKFGLTTEHSSNGHKSPDDKISMLRNRARTLQSAISQHVIGQQNMVLINTIALMTGDTTICLIGGYGIAKTHSSEVAMQAFGLKYGFLSLNPDTTCADITGYLKLDLETHKTVYEPSPFLGANLGNQGMIIDEFNRSSEKAQDALLEIIGNRRVTVGETRHLCDDYPIICTMNPPGSPGTKPLHPALANRIDFTLMVKQPDHESRMKIVDYKIEQQKTALSRRSIRLKSSISSSQLQECRQLFYSHLQAVKNVDPTLNDLANQIVEPFFDSQNWQTPASVRTSYNIVKMATAVALIRDGDYPSINHVWEVAPGCLGMVKPINRMTHPQTRLAVDAILEDRMRSIKLSKHRLS